MENKAKTIDLEYEMLIDGYSKKEIAVLLGIPKFQVRKDLKMRMKMQQKQTIFISKMPIISFN